MWECIFNDYYSMIRSDFIENKSRFGINVTKSFDGEMDKYLDFPKSNDEFKSLCEKLNKLQLIC